MNKGKNTSGNMSTPTSPTKNLIKTSPVSSTKTNTITIKFSTIINFTPYTKPTFKIFVILSTPLNSMTIQKYLLKSTPTSETFGPLLKKILTT